MKKLLLILLFGFSLKNGIAQVSDSAILRWSNYTCACIDTLDFNIPEEELKKQLTVCKTISLANLLNEKLITHDLLADEKKAADFVKKGVAHLAENCKSVRRLNEALNKEPVFDETNADELFTPAAFFETYGLKKGETNTRLHVYNNYGKEVTKFQRLVDIRWTFKTEADAMKWHQLNLGKNSEGGEPVKDKLVIRGAAGLSVFRENPKAAELMKAMGVGQRHHYFLFVYKNIVCKIFVATDENTNTVETAPFAIAAVMQLETVIK